MQPWSFTLAVSNNMIISKSLNRLLLSFAWSYITGGYTDIEVLAVALEALAVEARKQADA